MLCFFSYRLYQFICDELHFYIIIQLSIEFFQLPVVRKQTLYPELLKLDRLVDLNFFCSIQMIMLLMN